MADIEGAERRLVVDLVEDDAAAAAAGCSDVVLIDEGADAAPRLPEQARPQPDGSVILPLLRPVTLRFRRTGSDAVREEHVTELHLHRLTGIDMRAIAAAGSDGTMVTLARAARMHEARFGPLLDRMDGADVTAAFDVVAVFLGSGRRTGR